MAREEEQGEGDARPDAPSDAPADAPLDATLIPNRDPGDLPAFHADGPIEIDGYDGLVQIGRGGFATVWRAQQLSIGRTVALKVLDQRISDESVLRRVQLESRSLGELSWNPHIVHIYDSGTTRDGRPFLAMEYLEGGTIGERVRADGPLPAAQVLNVGLALTDALNAAHEAGVLHRDIKPDNVLLDRRGEPRLADFGIAQMAGHATATHGGSFRGTILYAAPELLDSEPPSAASDIWGIGATLYMLAAGQAPFARSGAGEDSVSAIMKRTLLEDPPALPDAIPAALRDVILACLAKEPEDRPPTVADVRRRLTEVASDIGGGPSGATGAAVAGVVGGATRPTASPAAASRAADAPAADAGDTGGGPAPIEPPTIDGSTPIPEPGRSGFVSGARFALVLSLVAVVAGIGWLVTRDESDSGATGTSSTTTTETTTTDTSSTETTTTGTEGPRDLGDPEPPKRPEGVVNAAPVPGTDTSTTLRADLDEFAASTDSAVVRETPTPTVIDGEFLSFGALPAEFDYASVNVVANVDCRRVYLDDVGVVGAAGYVWTTDDQIVLVNAVQLSSPALAERYYWATSLHFGLDTGECEGWPANAVAVNPDDLVVDRNDFDVDSDADDLLTGIGTKVAWTFEAKSAYLALARVDDTVLIINLGSTAPTMDGSAATETIEEIIGSFTN